MEAKSHERSRKGEGLKMEGLRRHSEEQREETEERQSGMEEEAASFD